jgi:hypothetical protein
MSQNSTIFLEELPEALGTMLNIDAEVAGLLITAVLLLMFLMPLLLVKRSKGFMAEMMVGIIILCVCVGLQWAPYWVALIIALLTAIMLSSKMKGWLG